MAEQDQPKNKLIVAYVVIIVVSLVGVIIAIREVFNHVVRSEVTSKVLARPSNELRLLRAQEQERLSKYQWVNREQGTVHIPLDRAVELTLRDRQEYPPAQHAQTKL